jgi:two-component system OmpR family response regulator
MNGKASLTVNEHDVYALSDKGNEELHGAETSLSPAEIELLVRIDGSQTVGQIAENVRLLAGNEVIEAFQKLLGANLVRLRARRKSEATDLGEFLSGASPAQPTRQAMAKAKAEAASGATTLQKQGYYVRIARRDAAKPKASGARALSVIVVEDEPLLAKFLKQYLSFENMEARVAANREEIVTAFRSPPVPDLVLLDVMLPDADGFDVLLKMRQHPALKSVPVIMLTAKATREAVLKGLAGGADGYITKPFEPDALIKAVRAVLGLPKRAEGKRDIEWT